VCLRELGPTSYMRSFVDRQVVMQRIPVMCTKKAEPRITEGILRTRSLLPPPLSLSLYLSLSPHLYVPAVCQCFLVMYAALLNSSTRRYIQRAAGRVGTYSSCCIVQKPLSDLYLYPNECSHQIGTLKIAKY